MPRSDQDPSQQAAPTGHFHTTHWSLVLLAGQSQEPQSVEALETLCTTYWPPLYAYARRAGHTREDAQDLTQDFFARLLEKQYLRLASQDRGRFRSFLLKSLQHFLVNDWQRSQAQKRGGGQKILSLDEAAAEQSYLEQPSDQLSPECLYDKRWALTVVERALDRLGADYAAASKSHLFNQLKELLLCEGRAEAYREKSADLGLSEGAVKVAVHRLRQRFRAAVRTEIAQTVATPSEVDEELRHLMAALAA